MQAAWRTSHHALAHTTGAERVIAEHSDHDITEAEPEVVILGTRTRLCPTVAV